MRLSSPTPRTDATPEAWIESLRRAGYTASDAPFQWDSDDALIIAYIEAAEAAGILIGEIGAWSNPLDTDPVKARAAIAKCQRQLEHADRFGIRCCVNIAGSRHPSKGRGPHPLNFSDETFGMIVDTTREIVDAVKPRRAFYCLEAMPWIFPSSPDEYLALLEAIDRPKSVAVHLDPANMINTPARAYRTGDFIRECFAKLGPYIKSAHAKDIILRDHLTVHLDECRPGTGLLDYATYLRELDKLDPDLMLFIEHLPMEEYPLAAGHIRNVARDIGVVLR